MPSADFDDTRQSRSVQLRRDNQGPRMTDVADIERSAAAAIKAGVGVADASSTQAGPGPEQAKPTAATSPLTAAQLALHTGWTMAVLYTIAPLPAAGAAEGPPPAELPTVRELPELARRTVELARLNRLLDCLSTQPGSIALPRSSALSGSFSLPGSSALTATATGMDATAADFPTRVRDLHVQVLGVLAAAGLELEIAYELGRSLRNTVHPHADPKQKETSLAPAVADLLDRGRIAKLQEGLATLAAEFPPQVAAIVSASMGRWSDFADVTVGKSAAKNQKIANKDRIAGQMRDSLARQGDVWLMLLVGVQSTAGLLTPEGYVTAGEAALKRSARIVRRVLAHYWAAALCLAAALGGVLYLAVAELAGAGQVWTSIAAIGSAMGISTQSIRSVISRLSTEAERPVLTAAEEDAKAWAITTLPQADLTLWTARKVRKAGIAKPVGLGRF